MNPGSSIFSVCEQHSTLKMYPLKSTALCLSRSSVTPISRRKKPQNCNCNKIFPLKWILFFYKIEYSFRLYIQLKIIELKVSEALLCAENYSAYIHFIFPLSGRDENGYYIRKKQTHTEVRWVARGHSMKCRREDSDRGLFTRELCPWPLCQTVTARQSHSMIMNSVAIDLNS